MIVRHQRASASSKGFRQLTRYIRGRSDKPRATWFLAVNLAGVTRPGDLELACRLVEAVHAQNTRAGGNRTYHLVISLHPEDRSLNGNELRRVVEHLVETLGFSGHQYIAARHNDKDHEHVHVAINKVHPETFRIHSPAWDHQKLFTAGRGLEVELGLTPLQSRARDRERVPQRAADCEAHQGIDSFARWAQKTLGPALRAGELRSWDELHQECAYLGVVLRPHGNGLVFEDVEQGMRVKASFVDRQLSKPGSPRYPSRAPTGNACGSSSHCARPSTSERSSTSSPVNAKPFTTPRIPAPGVTSSPVVPETATRAPFDSSIDKRGAEPAQSWKESYDPGARSARYRSDPADHIQR